MLLTLSYQTDVRFQVSAAWTDQLSSLFKMFPPQAMTDFFTTAPKMRLVSGVQTVLLVIVRRKFSPRVTPAPVASQANAMKTKQDPLPQHERRDDLLIQIPPGINW